MSNRFITEIRGGVKKEGGSYLSCFGKKVLAFTYVLKASGSKCRSNPRWQFFDKELWFLCDKSNDDNNRDNNNNNDYNRLTKGEGDEKSKDNSGNDDVNSLLNKNPNVAS